MSTTGSQAQSVVNATPAPFVDRRKQQGEAPSSERRQFANSYTELSPDACELAAAIDDYKLRHCRRFITYEEMHLVILSLGYRRAKS